MSTTIISFVGSHLQMKNTLEKAKAEMDAAVTPVESDEDLGFAEIDDDEPVGSEELDDAA